MRSRRVGPATFLRLLRDHEGDADAALAALPAVASAAGVADYRPCPPETAARELAAGRAAGAVPVFLGAPDYPPALARIDEAPPMLWVRGDTALLAPPAIAVVGARNASSLGLRMARALARGLGEGGAPVVSGLARGIDTAAHEAALDTGTLAVLAGGIDVVYPPENAALMERIAAAGLLVSEMPPGTRPQARHFPRRNRIISGIARGVVVVEAAPRSGSLITARDALDQGREVMAVPGHPFDARAAGCNILIRDGATLVRNAADVFAATGLQPAARDTAPDRRPGADAPNTGDTGGAQAPAPPRERPAAMPPAELSARILDLLGPAPLAEDQLLRDLDQPQPQVGAVLLNLELDGRIARQPGGLLSRTAG